MAKLKLAVDALRVETFETSEKPGSRGTVRGNDSLSNDTWCGAYGCDSTQLQILCTCTAGGPGNTCDVSCAGTCVDETCDSGCPGHTQDAHCPTNPGYPGCDR